LLTILRQPGLDTTNWWALAIRFGVILHKV
jgi:hypothetical protein